MQHPPIDWDDLRVVLAVSRTGSLSAAAKQLEIDRATVMRRLDTLEDRLGAHLIRRARDGCSLTSIGAAIVDKLGTIEDAVGGIRTIASGTDQQLEGSVRVTAPEWLSYSILADALGELRARHPQLCVALVATNQILSVFRSEADIAIRNVRPQQATLTIRLLPEFAFGLYASRAYHAQIKTRPWAERDIIQFDTDQAFMPGYKGLAERVPPSRVAMRASETMPMLAAVRAGLGIGALPCSIGDREPQLVRVPPGVVSRFKVWLVSHKDMLRQRRVRLVFDHLAAVFAAHAKLLGGAEPR